MSDLTPEQERDFETVYARNALMDDESREALSRLRSNLEAARLEIDTLTVSNQAQYEAANRYQSEVERLRTQNLQLEDENSRLAEGRDAEVERLRADGEHAHAMWLHWLEKYEVEHDEVERLRGEIAALTRNVVFYADQGSEGWLEVERLRASETEWANVASDRAVEMDVLRKEVERLRAMHVEAFEEEANKLRAEVERLRNIIESHDGPGYNYEMKKLEAEVEHLRAELTRANDHFNEVVPEQAEVERLQGILDADNGAIESLQHEVGATKAENKRLRAELECGGPHSAAEIHRMEEVHKDETDAYQAEIGRLWAALANADSPVEDIYEGKSAREWWQENERLRAQQQLDVEAIEALKQEVESLRESLLWTEVELEKTEAEVEQLRAALERIDKTLGVIYENTEDEAVYALHREAVYALHRYVGQALQPTKEGE